MVEVFKVTDESVKNVACKLFSDAGLDPEKIVSVNGVSCEDWETEAVQIREELEILAHKLNQLFTDTSI
jgi:hypothetical protein